MKRALNKIVEVRETESDESILVRNGLEYLWQEPISRNLQLRHIPVTAFSQTDLFLV